jgi:hypothetical protein
MDRSPEATLVDRSKADLTTNLSIYPIYPIYPGWKAASLPPVELDGWMDRSPEATLVDRSKADLTTNLSIYPIYPIYPSIHLGCPLPDIPVEVGA